MIGLMISWAAGENSTTHRSHPTRNSRRRTTVEAREPKPGCPVLQSYFPCQVSKRSMVSGGKYLCNACLDPKRPTRMSSSQASKPTPGKHLHLIVMCPAFWGSSALQQLIASSPVVSTMCHRGTWQCEATWLLVGNGKLMSTIGLAFITSSSLQKSGTTCLRRFYWKSRPRTSPTVQAS